LLGLFLQAIIARSANLIRTSGNSDLLKNVPTTSSYRSLTVHYNIDSYSNT